METGDMSFPKLYSKEDLLTFSLIKVTCHCVTGAVLTHDVMYPEDFF